jgi:hypothetical protein
LTEKRPGTDDRTESIDTTEDVPPFFAIELGRYFLLVLDRPLKYAVLAVNVKVGSTAVEFCQELLAQRLVTPSNCPPCESVAGHTISKHMSQSNGIEKEKPTR